MVYRLKKKFAFYYIKQLFDSNFDIKSQISTIGPLLAATLPAILSVPFTSPSSTFGLSILASANTPIYLMQLSDKKLTSLIYSTFALYKSNIGSTSRTYMQLLETRPILAIKTISRVYI